LADFISGFSLGLSLIMAIGAQNAFVLKSGLRREHIFIICTLCALSDAALIAAGIFGFGSLLDAVPSLEIVMRWAGACFLSVYGAKSFLSAWRGGASLQAAGASNTLTASVLTCLALTWLNPHVYLDTVVLLGAVAAQHDDRFIFGLGAVSASFVFFYALGFGARLLAPVFSKPLAWRVLDACVGALMWAIALHLFFG
jgi:L-lysine exporter family protein LysE/ArgO|tara:strand:+ start:573 stop:1166 length:594 start_codon:yes stop_codon:yes gene_type:complete